MTSPGRYAASDSSFAKSTGNAAARGGALIGIAVVIGFLLLWKGGVGGDSDAAAVSVSNDESSDTGSVDDTSEGQDNSDGEGQDESAEGAAADESGAEADGSEDAATEDPVATPTTRPVNDVKVVVANGVGTAGLAGERTTILLTAGYTAQAADAATTPVAASVIYYTDGYDLDAAGVAAQLGGDTTLLRPLPPDPGALLKSGAEADEYNVWVVLGADGVLG